MKLEKVTLEQFTTPMCELVDVKWTSTALKNVIAIIILIDGTTFTPKSTAQFLQTLLNNPVFLSNPAPILLAVNKSESKRAVHNTVVYDQTEAEMRALTGLEDYSFKIYSPCTIYACNCSIKSNSISTLTEFIHACI